MSSVDPERQFARAADLLALEDTVSARDVVNVLGRWSTYKQWESVGELRAMDKLFDANGQPLKKMKAQQTSSLLGAKKGNGDWVKKTPERRGFCLRLKLCQRYWFAENVERLPFKAPRLAASVGATANELDRLPVDPLAVDVVFDALAKSKSGILDREVCDAQRASYETVDGDFDAEKFAADLTAGRLKVFRSLLIFPGSVIAVQAAVFYKLDGLQQTLEYLAMQREMLDSNAALWQDAVGL